MSKSTPAGFTPLFQQSLAATVDGHVARTGIDESRWLEAADEHFRAENRLRLAVLHKQAVADRKRDEQRAFIRRSRHPAIEAQKELSRIARAAKRSARIEQIEIEPGQYVAKRVIDCTRHELLLLADQYERKARGMLRRAAFYRTLEAQLALAGIGESETLGDWIAQQERAG